jgi:hypothetical protein
MKRCKNGKVKYRTEKEANKARMYILSHDPSAGMLDLLPYVCPQCGFFHVGHRSKYILSTAHDSKSTVPPPSDNRHGSPQ